MRSSLSDSIPQIENDTGIVSMSLTGADPQVVLEPRTGHTSDVGRIAADERSSCWLPGDAIPGCMPQDGGEVRVLGEDAGTTTDMELTEGVLVWLVSTQEGIRLIAAIP